MTQRRATGRAVPDPPLPDEAHVLATGLDPLAAGICLALADAGVCLFNVNDPAPVTVADTRTGIYPAEAEGQPRELVLRGMLRRRARRCVPLSAPELFPTAAVGGAVVLRSWTAPGGRPAAPPSPALDADLPALSIVSEGAHAVTWPLTTWGHRPCPECIGAAVRDAHRRRPAGGPRNGVPEHSPQEQTLAAVTRTVATGEIAGRLLCAALGLDDVPGSDPRDRPGTVCSRPLALRRGLVRTALAPNPNCLCSLAFTVP